jgi:hypothetical protein
MNAIQEALVPVGQTSVYIRADGFGDVTPPQECGPNGREPIKEFQMHSQTLKTAAIGVMLFGGTLGSTTVANAGLTVTGADIYLDVNAAAQFQTSNLAVAMAGGMPYDTNTGGYLQLSAFTSTGFNLKANSAGGAATWSVFPSYFTFTADTLTTVTLSGNTAAESAVIFLWDNTSNSTLFLRGEGGSGVEWTSGDIVLAAGHSYTLTVNPGYANGSTEVGTVLNFAVPAPGAIALLGAAGLIGGRRRRA